MESVWQYIHTSVEQHHPLLALLLDPDKGTIDKQIVPHLNGVDLILVGGSLGKGSDQMVQKLRTLTQRPIVLFPGNITQFTPKADALLFLSMLSSERAEMLILPHISVAQKVLESHIETIPMGYILVDGGKRSSVERASHSHPIPQQDIERIVSTAIAGQLLGKKMIYLEAGSGAIHSVEYPVIKAVAEKLNIPLIVGGGIRTKQQMIDAFRSGANMVVIGNHFEAHPSELSDFIEEKIHYEQSVQTR